MKPGRLESLLAGLLNVGTWLASIVIAAGLVLSLFHEQTPFPTGAQDGLGKAQFESVSWFWYFLPLIAACFR
jgi:hypothetical protein